MEKWFQAGLLAGAGLVAANALSGVAAPQWLQWGIVVLFVVVALTLHWWIRTFWRRVGLLVTGVVLLVTVFIVVRPVEEVEEPAGRRNAPAILATIDDAAVGQFVEFGVATNIPYLSLIVTIANRGASPTTISEFALAAKLPNGELRHARRLTIPEKQELRYYGADRRFETIYGSDALDDKAMLAPISSGGVVRGRLLFEFHDTKPDELMANDVNLILHLRDAFGVEYDQEFRPKGWVRDYESQIPDFPGIKPRRP